MVRAVLATFHHDGRPSYRSVNVVAAELGLSPQAVTSLLQKAFKEGLFSTLINLPQETQDVIRLEGAVKAKYGLQKVLLVPGLPEVLEELDQARHRAVHTEVIQAMARLVAAHLDELVAAAARDFVAALGSEEPEPFVMGVAWGRSMHLIAQHLLSTPRPVRFPGLVVIPIVGITSVRNTEPIEANVIAMDIARAYGGVSEQLPCSAFAQTIDYQVVTQPKPVRQCLRKIPTSKIVITSMGSIPESPDGATEITLSNDPVMNATLFQLARRDGAIGEICYSLFDRNGKEVRSDYTGIGLGFDGLRAIAADKRRQVILVTGGDRRRFEPLRAALHARLASVLVSDTVTARYLVDELPLAA